MVTIFCSCRCGWKDGIFLLVSQLTIFPSFSDRVTLWTHQFLCIIVIFFCMLEFLFVCCCFCSWTAFIPRFVLKGIPSFFGPITGSHSGIFSPSQTTAHIYKPSLFVCRVEIELPVVFMHVQVTVWELLRNPMFSVLQVCTTSANGLCILVNGLQMDYMHLNMVNCSAKEVFPLL